MLVPTLKTQSSGWLLNLAIIFFILLALMSGSLLLFDLSYRNKFFPGVRLGTLDLGGLTPAQANTLLGEKISSLNERGIILKYQNREYSLLPTIASGDADIALDLIAVDQNKTIAQAYQLGRDGGWIENTGKKIKILIFGETPAINLSLNDPAIKKTLSGEFSIFETPSQDARLIYNQSQDQFEIGSEQAGWSIDYDSAITELRKNLSVLNFSPITLTADTVEPAISKNEVLNVNAGAKEILALAPLTLNLGSSTAGTAKWEIKKNTLAGWLGLKINPAGKNNGDKIIIGLNQGEVSKYLTEIIAAEIDRPASTPRFEIKNGKVSIFQSSQKGLALNIAASLASLESELIDKKNSTIQLSIDELPAELATPGEDFGIKELIGTGQSNFAGSPKNRRHNIAVGADTLDGTLIKPDETFSLIKTLGAIDASNGYLQELVIKGNKTIPEFGGGLCQIGTTMFRAALGTGLPIAERRNHSYRVVYYEPAGTDATIYDPSPDLKFINDTGNYILIQSRIEKDNLFFDFWGSSDGRVATRTKPTIYNIVKPAAARIVETTDLKPGEKKCTEKAHNGADAYFDYKVVYASGEIKEKKFSSHYIPWQEVCLLGVEKISGNNSSSTPTTATSTAATSTKP
jgi:vancomycin resistance protein YoaR